MKKIDTRNIIFNQLKIPELMTQILHEELDKPYEEVEKLVSDLFLKKIDKVEKSIALASKINKSDIDTSKDFEQWVKDKPVIKG